MSTGDPSLAAPNYIFLVRAILIIFGCVAFWWGIVAFRDFWTDSSTESIATRVLAGDPFKTEVMDGQISAIRRIESAAFCRPVALRSAAVIQLRIVEVSAPQSGQSEARLYSLLRMIRSALSCAPADSFLWLALYSVENTANHFSADDLKYLRMSYELSPNEGWIALRRNPVAFERFRQLPADLAETAIHEFIQLLLSNFFEPAAAIFTGPAWPERELILAHLTQISSEQRRFFADALQQRGYDLNMPNIERQN
jgi:hypothetical protein